MPGSLPPSLHSSLLKARLAQLPHMPAVAPHSVVNEGAGSSHDAGASSMPPPSHSSSSSAQASGMAMPSAGAEDFSPLSAGDCFQQALAVDVGDATFRVYYTPPSPSASSSGAGPSAAPAAAAAAAPTLSRASDETLASLTPPPVPADDEDEGGASAAPAKEEERDPGTLFVLHHGAGYSALSFALVARELRRLSGGTVGVLAMDCRGHGRTAHPEPSEMSLSNLTSDLASVLHALFPSAAQMPSLVLIGHSMGGSVIVSLSSLLLAPPISLPPRKIAGVAVLDVVEGTAMAALGSMRSIVLAQPAGFESVEEAVGWHMDSGAIRNLDSARRSVPSLLKPNDAGGDAAPAACTGRTSIAEEDESAEHMEVLDSPVSSAAPLPASTSSSSKRHALVWRHNLLATEPFWRGWFEGLSKRFLGVKAPRLLLLAGTDRLDKELMIGQMQGKYQLVVFPDVGHSLQEDAPEKTAQTLLDFWRRNQAAPIPVRVHRVGQ